MTSMLLCSMFFYFFFNNTAPTEIYTLSLHDALPISIWFFIPCLLAGALPWSVLVLAGWRRSLRLRGADRQDRKSTRLNSSHSQISYAVFCLKKKSHKNSTSHVDTLHDPDIVPHPSVR